MKQTAIKVSLALIFGVCAMAAQAATLNTGDRLTINSGAAITAIDANGNPVVTGFTGSWFGVNINFNGMGGTGKAPLSQGTDGVIIGMAQPYGSIDAPWMWQGFIGGHRLKRINLLRIKPSGIAI